MSADTGQTAGDFGPEVIINAAGKKMSAAKIEARLKEAMS